MSCKNCSDVTLLSGNDGNGIQTVIDNGDGTFTFFFTDGSTFTTPNFSGTPGTPGTAATITVGTVTIGPPGTPPSVTNSGTSEAAVFDFVFPIGIGYGKTLWVDDQFGSDIVGEAVRDRIDLPWKTINAAITNAVAGDTIHVRTGSYTEEVALKHLVNVYLDEGVIIDGNINDGALSNVTASVTGHGRVIDNNTASNCIKVLKDGSNIDIKLHSITNKGTGILHRTNLESNLFVEVDFMDGQTTNYFVALSGESNLTFKVNEYIKTDNPTNPTVGFEGINCREGGGVGSYSGTLNFSAPEMIIEDGTSINGGTALYVESGTTSAAKVYFNVDKLINNYNQDINTQSASKGTLTLNGNGKYIIKVKDCFSLSRVGLMVGGGDVSVAPSGVSSIGTTIFEGMIYSQKQPAIRMYALDNSNQKAKLIVRNSSLTRGINPEGDGITPDRNSVVILNNAGFEPAGANAGGNAAVYNYINAEFIDTQIVKVGDNSKAGATLDPEPNNALVCIQTKTDPSPSMINFRGCDLISGSFDAAKFNAKAIVGFATRGNLTAISTDTDVYFRDTRSNCDIIATGSAGAVVETATVFGFTTDPDPIRTLNYLHD